MTDDTVADRFGRLLRWMMDVDGDDQLLRDETVAARMQAECERLSHDVAALGLFSPNEHYAELNPTHLALLLLPAFNGRLTARETDGAKRVGATHCFCNELAGSRTAHCLRSLQGLPDARAQLRPHRHEAALDGRRGR